MTFAFTLGSTPTLLRVPDWAKAMFAPPTVASKPPAPVEAANPEQVAALRSILDCGPITSAVTFPNFKPGSGLNVCNIVGRFDCFVLPHLQFHRLVKRGWLTSSAQVTLRGHAVLAATESDM